jgi:hypothetical protein
MEACRLALFLLGLGGNIFCAAAETHVVACVQVNLRFQRDLDAIHVGTVRRPIVGDAPEPLFL